MGRRWFIPIDHRRLSAILKQWRWMQSLAAARQHAFYRGEQIDIIDGGPPGFADGSIGSGRRFSKPPPFSNSPTAKRFAHV